MRKANVIPIFSHGQKDILGSSPMVPLMLGKPWSVLSWSVFLEEEGVWEQAVWTDQG